MTREEYLIGLESMPIDNNIVNRVEVIYDCALPIVVKQMISYSKESVFFDNGFRILSLAEILNAQADLHVDFRALKLVPIIDCGDNDFIVYHISDNSWSKFNIVDEIIFKKRRLLTDLFA